MRYLLLLIPFIFLINSGCGERLKPGSSQTEQEPGSPDFQNSCSKLTIENQAKFGESCLKEVSSGIDAKYTRHSLPFIDLRNLENLTKATPDVRGAMASYYKATLGAKKVFIKFLDWTDGVIKRPTALTSEKELFFNEIYWIQKLAQENLGPAILGVTFMEEAIGTRADKAFALVFTYIDGKTYPIVGDQIQRNPSPEHKVAIESVLLKLKAFSDKYKANAIDVQIMVDQHNRGWVIDPAQFRFRE